MRYPRLHMSIFALLAAISSRADDTMPARPNFSRYETMLQHSPFAVASAVAPPAATPNFAKDLYVANAAHLPECDMVTIASTSDKNFREYLTTKGPVDGYSIASIEWSEKVGATKVTISKDGQFATLGFNEALLSQPPSPNVPGQPQPPPQPGVPNRAAGAGAAIPVPTPAVPAGGRTPHVRGTIPRYPSARPTPRPGRP
jgi:hypothetical protein